MRKANQAVGGFAVEQSIDPLAHFACRLVGKGNGADLPGGVSPPDQPGYLAGDDTSLAATGAGKNEAGPIDAFNRLLLRFIEVLQVQGE